MEYTKIGIKILSLIIIHFLVIIRWKYLYKELHRADYVLFLAIIIGNKSEIKHIPNK